MKTGKNLMQKYQLLSLQRYFYRSQQEVRHHRKVEKLESECSDLHQRLAHAKSQKKSTSQSQAPKSMVEQYSQVLDELEHARLVCPNVDPPDLPRVIVVGDQSSGKTSVLEAVARARIFPRGGGQMMTRSPVKVTIADGPRHIASFPDQPDKYYRLDDEEHLKQLRSQIEHRMARACHGGLTISSEVVPINVEGPGLRRMVLVDLPGLICTETAGIRPGTAAEILNLAREQMDFPNAIILCVQDGSVDAERSQVTNYVREADPTGERTLLVLTKVDKAVADPVRLKQILDGKLFPLRALGYFAVVTGNENKDASIAEIRKSENQFFQQSPLLNSGILQPDQLGTNNLCDAVSKLFWHIVKNSLSGELQKLKEQLFILESEWKAQYRHRRELDRDQTFGRVKEQLFDRMVLMKNLDPGQFENDLKAKLWETIESYFLHEVYLAAEDSAKSKEEFKAISDLRLRKFSNQELPNQSLEAVRALLIARFAELVLPELSNEANAEHTTLYQKISNDVQREFDGYFKSNKTARASELRVIQQSTIENRFINSKIEWQSAADRLKITLHNDVEKRWAHVWDAAGPVWYQQYWNWTARTKDQHEWDRIKRVLQILPMDTQSKLTKDQLAKARFDIQKFFSIEATEADIDDVWRDLYPTRWIAALEKNAAHCRGSFQKYKDGKVSCESSRLQCEDVMLWWRMDRALEMSAANLRQFMLTEGVDTLANELQNSLDNLSENDIVELIKGRQVELAEELKYIRKIHGLLHELNRMLNQVYGQ
ncbi:unnamed protein product [Oikopleura dioica]|uniref:Dynamin-like GTPase OPA1, mitochondrial n=1 Tax=Oikopleura dioica TaxID=34765 RepID=E4WWL4_OIKDI|nr:unnamed protein product [Oikopleura dioica]